MAQTVRDGERIQTELAFDEIREELIQVEERNGNLNAICDVCFIRSLGANIAIYLCYMCNTYLCQDCFKGHESHRFIKKGEKERMKKCFLDEMMNESESERKEMFDREDVSVVDRVNVKHELDKRDNYRITGLCGLDDTRWVVCDICNYCIKVFSIGSHILQRYIRFGSAPYDVTEIKVEREPTEEVVMAATSDNKVKKVKPLKCLRAAITTFFSVKREPTEQVVMTTNDMSVTKQPKLDKQCLLAVTLTWARRILFINLTQNPAVITKSINTEKYCWSIEFSEAKIFILCSDDKYPGHGPWFVTVMSTDGVTIKTINTHLYSYRHDLAVCPGRIYLTAWRNDKVLCMNDEGKVVSHKTIEGSRPGGISVDPDTNNIYIGAWGNYKVYRIDSRLESFESLVDLKSVDSGRPNALCVYRNRLYVSHGLESTHLVTVVRVL